MHSSFELRQHPAGEGGGGGGQGPKPPQTSTGGNQRVQLERHCGARVQQKHMACFLGANSILAL